MQFQRINPSFHSPTANILSFVLCFAGLEALLVLYWTSLQLIPTLPYFGILAFLTAYTGRNALGDVRRRRVLSEAKGKKAE